MKIKLERDCAIAGLHCEKGEVVDVSEQDGTYLVNVGLAKAADDGAKAKKQTVKKIKILMKRSCMVAGKHRELGDVVSALEADAKFLLGHGHAFVDGSDKAKELKAELKKSAQAAEKEAAEKEAAEKEAAEKEAEAKQ